MILKYVVLIFVWIFCPIKIKTVQTSIKFGVGKCPIIISSTTIDDTGMRYISNADGPKLLHMYVTATDAHWSILCGIC